MFFYHDKIKKFFDDIQNKWNLAPKEKGKKNRGRELGWVMSASVGVGGVVGGVVAGGSGVVVAVVAVCVCVCVSVCMYVCMNICVCVCVRARVCV